MYAIGIKHNHDHIHSREIKHYLRTKIQGVQPPVIKFTTSFTIRIHLILIFSTCTEGLMEDTYNVERNTSNSHKADEETKAVAIR